MHRKVSLFILLAIVLALLMPVAAQDGPRIAVLLLELLDRRLSCSSCVVPMREGGQAGSQERVGVVCGETPCGMFELSGSAFGYR